MTDLGDNLQAVRARVAAAALRSGRPPESVTIVAVGKRQPASAIDAAFELGVREVGENFAQELVRKRSESQHASEIAWHFIGHLQRNKVKQVVGSAALIQTIDSVRLAEAVDEQAHRLGIVQPVLLQVNIAGEETKHGVPPREAQPTLESLLALQHLRIDGLMAMPPLESDPEGCRVHARALVALRAQLQTPSQPLETLSIGTTSDYEVAIEEGSTMVRIGTAIFGERPL